MASPQSSFGADTTRPPRSVHRSPKIVEPCRHLRSPWPPAVEHVTESLDFSARGVPLPRPIELLRQSRSASDRMVFARKSLPPSDLGFVLRTDHSGGAPPEARGHRSA